VREKQSRERKLTILKEKGGGGVEDFCWLTFKVHIIIG